MSVLTTKEYVMQLVRNLKEREVLSLVSEKESYMMIEEEGLFLMYLNENFDDNLLRKDGVQIVSWRVIQMDEKTFKSHFTDGKNDLLVFPAPTKEEI